MGDDGDLFVHWHFLGFLVVAISTRSLAAGCESQPCGFDNTMFNMKPEAYERLK